jgi:hypothetical protein
MEALKALFHYISHDSEGYPIVRTKRMILKVLGVDRKTLHNWGKGKEQKEGRAGRPHKYPELIRKNIKKDHRGSFARLDDLAEIKFEVLKAKGRPWNRKESLLHCPYCGRRREMADLGSIPEKYFQEIELEEWLTRMSSLRRMLNRHSLKEFTKLYELIRRSLYKSLDDEQWADLETRIEVFITMLEREGQYRQLQKFKDLLRELTRFLLKVHAAEEHVEPEWRGDFCSCPNKVHTIYDIAALMGESVETAKMYVDRTAHSRSITERV